MTTLCSQFFPVTCEFLEFSSSLPTTLCFPFLFSHSIPQASKDSCGCGPPLPGEHLSQPGSRKGLLHGFVFMPLEVARI